MRRRGTWVLVEKEYTNTMRTRQAVQSQTRFPLAGDNSPQVLLPGQPAPPRPGSKRPACDFLKGVFPGYRGEEVP